MDNLRQILAKHNLSLKKAFGQNFLTDFDLLSRVVDKSGVDTNSTVIEIGVGAGTLTSEIAKKGEAAAEKKAARGDRPERGDHHKE